MMLKKPVLATSALLALCLALPTAAQDTGSSSGTATQGGSAASAQKLSHQDRKFVEDLTQANMAEIQLAQIAKERGQNQAVKDFADRMVNDHTQAGQRLSSLAGPLGITPPDKMDFMHRHLEKKLRKENPSSFDEEYIESQVKDHKKVLDMLKKESESGENADLKQFASQLQPTIQEHLQLAQQIQQQVKK